MTDLVSDTLESFSELAHQKGINLKGDVSPEVDPVLMDGQRISRVLNASIGGKNRAAAHLAVPGWG